MTKPETFDRSEEALQRGEWLNRQSQIIFESSEEVIRKSREAMKDALEIKVVYKGPRK